MSSLFVEGRGRQRNVPKCKTQHKRSALSVSKTNPSPAEVVKFVCLESRLSPDSFLVMGLLLSSEPSPPQDENLSKSPELTDLQIEMIRSSWQKVLPDKKHHGELLFHKVFETAPHLTDLFPFGSDLSNPMFTAHALNVMNAVDFAVQNLDNPDVLIPRLQELGRVHAFFQLTNIEFGFVGQALLSVLEEGLGDAFTPELKEAWRDTYAIITDVMLQAIDDYNSTNN